MTKIIAEFCQNHNGNFELLKKMINDAAEAGATHAKIQSIESKNLTFRPEFENGLMLNSKTHAIKRPYQLEFDRLKALEINDEQSFKFIELCKKNNLIPMTTCFVRSDVNRLYDIGFRVIKVASYDCGSFPLLSELSNKFDEIILSTGASFDEEIIHASKILKKVDFTLLHCITIYPTPLNDMNLLRMNWLRKFSKKIGFSDHSLVERDGIIASKVALSQGAEVIERHFTVLDKDKSKDGPVSINKSMLKELVEFSKKDLNEKIEILNFDKIDLKSILGKSNRELTEIELLNRNYYRGRFASIRKSYEKNKQQMIYNWEETPLSL